MFARTDVTYGAACRFRAWRARQPRLHLASRRRKCRFTPCISVEALDVAAVQINGRRPSRRAALVMLGAAAVLVLGDAWIHANLVSGSEFALRMRVVRDLPAM